jgi:hypothetical protein
MKKQPVTDTKFAENDPIIVIDTNSPFNNRAGIIKRLGSAGEDVLYLHAELVGVNTIITFRTFQVQKGS